MKQPSLHNLVDVGLFLAVVLLTLGAWFGCAPAAHRISLVRAMSSVTWDHNQKLSCVFRVEPNDLTCFQEEDACLMERSR